jgi:nitrilase
MPDVIKVAAAQASPCFLDKAKTVEKACALIRRAGSEGAALVVFPEAYISAYPDWVWLVPNSKAAELNALYLELVESAISIPDDATERLCEAARSAGIHVVMGANERNSESSGNSLYNTLLFIGDKGELLGKHRKLVPTGGERLVWAQGDGSTLDVFSTPLGKISGLICWENLMPLARSALYALGAQIHVAPTWDKSPGWTTAMQYIAREGGMFVIGCGMVLHKNDIPDTYPFRNLYPPEREWINTGNSCIINPKGEILAGPLQATEGLLYAELDLSEITAAKRMFDTAGHYARPDVFKLGINRQANVNLEFFPREHPG